MAGEFTYQIKRTWRSPGEGPRVSDTQPILTDQANVRQFSQTFAIGTTEAEIAIPADVTPGQTFLRNNDGTNFLLVGQTTTDYFAKLLPGEAAQIPWNPSKTSIFAKADTAACDMQVEVYSR